MDAITIKKAIAKYYTREAIPLFALEGAPANRKFGIRVSQLTGIRKGIKRVEAYQAWGWSDVNFRRKAIEIVYGVADKENYANIGNGRICLSPSDWDKVINSL